jgi:hypothetical protein
MDDDIEPDIQQMLSGTEMQICQDCRKIDFSLAITQRPPLDELSRQKRLARGTFVSRLDHFSANCALCLEFDAAKSNFRTPYEHYDLRAFRLPGAFGALGHSTVPSPPRTAWLQPMPRNETLGDGAVFAVMHEVERHGWIATYVTADGNCIFRPQSVRKQIDSALIGVWLNTCEENHPKSCNASVNMSGLVLIDCVTLQLHRASEQDKYVALSYVWAKIAPGVSKDSASSDIYEKTSLPPTDRLSQVIKDAIAVTKQLHFRYLWIDKYCINQHDASVKKHQIENMDLIYKGAEFTIIAAAGLDEHHGLPGVSIGRSQHVVEIGAYTILHMPPDPGGASREVTWAKRAWVSGPRMIL